METVFGGKSSRGWSHGRSDVDALRTHGHAAGSAYRPTMPRLVLINGAPGSGKSTLAHRLAQRAPLDLALDVDAIKHALGRWDTHTADAGSQARRLALALTNQHLSDEHDVYLGQFLARTDFIDQLEQLASRVGAGFVECVLIVDAGTLLSRLEHRAAAPQRPEHRVNAPLVTPKDVPAFVKSMQDLLLQRPSAMRIDASGDVEETLRFLEQQLTSPSGPRD